MILEDRKLNANVNTMHKCLNIILEAHSSKVRMISKFLINFFIKLKK